MKRRWFYSLTIVSLVLCIALMLAAVRSFWNWDGIAKASWNLREHLYENLVIESGQGGVDVSARSSPYGSPNSYSFIVRQNLNWRLIQNPSPPDRRYWSGLWRFRYVNNAGRLPDGAWSSVEVRVPYGPVILLLMIAPVMWVLRKRQQRQPGVCARCGYDLRATPQRCPECGTVAKGN